MKIRFLTQILFVVSVILLPSQIFSQDQCFSAENLNKIISSIDSPRVEENKTIRRELLKMVENQEKANRKTVENWETDKKFDTEARQIGKENALRLCAILSENGWLTKESVEIDGFNAVLYLIRNTRNLQFQREFVPILSAAAKKGQIAKENLASLIDKIRLASGLTQIFGTQTAVRDEIAYLFPLENEERVDEWRKIYEMPPLKVFFKEMETFYQTPVIKMPRPIILPKSAQNSATNISKAEAELIPGLEDQEEEEVLIVESKLVNLNVRVLSTDTKAAENLNLQKKDFELFENGRKQEISFFSTTDAAFDLVLMLDLSGSTADKQSVIEKSARRFIEVARPIDRIAIVAFTHKTEVIADFTNDKSLLYQKIKNIKGDGGSKIWDAVEFTYTNLLNRQKSENRRSAMILLTDGIDNSLIQNASYIFSIESEENRIAALPSLITFNDLLETIRQNDTTIFPIYVNDEYRTDAWSKKAYRQARRTLEIFADESGGGYYSVRKLKDLNGVYEQIINDLSKVYSLGYEPENAVRDGSWREISVKIKNQTTLNARTKSGYYAK